MLLWIILLTAFVLPLGCLCVDLLEERGARTAKLERIRSRIRQKEAEADVDD